MNKNNKKCPVKNCDGWHSYSAQANLINHIKNKAKTELLKRELLGTLETPHFDYIKKHHTIKKEPKIII